MVKPAVKTPSQKDEVRREGQSQKTFLNLQNHGFIIRIDMLDYTVERTNNLLPNVQRI